MDPATKEPLLIDLISMDPATKEPVTMDLASKEPALIDLISMEPTTKESASMDPTIGVMAIKDLALKDPTKMDNSKQVKKFVSILDQSDDENDSDHLSDNSSDDECTSYSSSRTNHCIDSTRTKLSPTTTTTSTSTSTSPCEPPSRLRPALVDISPYLPESLLGTQLSSPTDPTDPSSASLVNLYTYARLFYQGQPGCASLVSAILLAQFVLPKDHYAMLCPIPRQKVVERVLYNYHRYKTLFQDIFSDEVITQQNVDNSELDFSIFDVKDLVDSGTYSKLHIEALGSLLTSVIVLCKCSHGTFQFRQRIHAELNLSLGIRCRFSLYLDRLLNRFRSKITIALAEQIFTTLQLSFGTIATPTFKQTINFANYPGMITLRLILDTMKFYPDLPWFLVPESFPEEWHALKEAFDEFGGRRYIGIASYNFQYIKASKYQQIVLIVINFLIECGETGLAYLVVHDGVPLSRQATYILKRFLNENGSLKFRRAVSNHRRSQKSDQPQDILDSMPFEAFSSEDLQYLSSFLTIFMDDNQNDQLAYFNVDQ